MADQWAPEDPWPFEDELGKLTPEQRDRVLAGAAEDDIEALEWAWRGSRARQAQLAPPGAWRVWLLLAGRGFGKTRSGAEWVRERVEGRHARGASRWWRRPPPTRAT